MTRTRMFSDEPAEAPSPRTSIIGDRPPEDRPDLPAVPTGIQTLLRLAAVDPDFRRALLQHRVEVAGAAGVELTRSEEAILRVVPAEQLERMMDALPPPPTGRRVFLRQAAASAAGVLLGLGIVSELLSCQGQTPPVDVPGTGAPARKGFSGLGVSGMGRGISPDLPPPHPPVRETGADGGAVPEEPLSRPEVRETAGKGGSTSEEPPPRPRNSKTEKSGGAPPDRSPRPAGIRPDLPRPQPVPQMSRGIRPDLPEPPGASEEGE